MTVNHFAHLIDPLQDAGFSTSELRIKDDTHGALVTIVAQKGDVLAHSQQRVHQSDLSDEKMMRRLGLYFRDEAKRIYEEADA